MRVIGIRAYQPRPFPRKEALISETPVENTFAINVESKFTGTPGITISFTASKTSGTVPLAVFFDATATTSTLTNDPYHDLDYFWDFGDWTAGLWGTNGNLNEHPKNIAYGPTACHVFETSGTFTVTCMVKHRDGTTVSNSLTVSPTASNSFYSSTKTRCVSIAGSFTGAPSGAEQVTSSDVAAQFTWLNGATGRRLMFKAGETWTSGANNITQNNSTITRFGTGNNPIINVNASAPFISPAGSTTDRGLRVMDLDIRGTGGTGYFWNGFAGTQRDHLFLRVEARGFLNAVANTTFLDNTGSTYSSANMHRHIYIVDCNFHDTFGRTVFLGAENIVLMASRFERSSNSDTVKIWTSAKLTCWGNVIKDAGASSFQALKITHGEAAWGSTITAGRYVLVLNNNIASGVSSTVCAIKETDVSGSGIFEDARDFIISSNFFTAASTASSNIFHNYGFRLTTFKNNICKYTTHTGTCIAASMSDVPSLGPSPTNCTFYNNTIYRNNPSSNPTYICDARQNPEVRNNICFPTAGTANIFFTGSSGVSSNNLLANPNFVNAGADDFHLLSSSTAIDQGTNLDRVVRDFENNTRDGTWEIGAFSFLVVSQIGIFTTSAEMASLAASGTAWNNMKSNADSTPQTPDLSNQDDPENCKVLARAMVYARIGGESYKTSVIKSCMQCMGSEAGGRVLAIGRELGAYIVSMDLISAPPNKHEIFKRFCKFALTESLSGDTIITIDEHKPNNWRGHASWTRVCIARYLNDSVELARCAQVQEGWMGNLAQYEYQENDWGDSSSPDNVTFAYHPSWHNGQFPNNLRGINPVGATILGNNVDGVLPDDQRREPNDGGFVWPTAAQNYVYECLQGIIGSCIVLKRAGYDPFNWQSQAVKRAYLWLYNTSFSNKPSGYPAEGDDRWQIWIVNKEYGISLATGSPGAPVGKNLAYTDWLYQ